MLIQSEESACLSAGLVEKSGKFRGAINDGDLRERSELIPQIANTGSNQLMPAASAIEAGEEM
ncbi:hypothetical protein R6G99_10825 [Actinotignum timonense]|nr:hypothetical protein [Actinotignum timonense]